jgi:hypothetical protein
MAVLLATLLLYVGDTPPLTVDEDRIEDETIIKPTVSNSSGITFPRQTRKFYVAQRKEIPFMMHRKWSRNFEKSRKHTRA